MSRWLWICPMLAGLASISIFFYWGWSWTAAGLIALATACPAIAIWGVAEMRKTRRVIRTDPAGPDGKR